MRLQRIPIRFRVALIAALASALAAVVIGGLSLSRSFAAIQDDFDGSLAEEAAEMLIAVSNDLPLATFMHPVSALGEPEAVLLNSSGRLIDATSSHLPSLPAGLPTNKYSTVTGASGEKFRLLALPLPESNGSVMAAMISLELIEDRNGELLLSVIGWSSVAVGAVVVGSYLVTGFVLRPINNLTDAARSIGRDPSGRRLDVPPVDDEVRHLAETLNAGIGRIEEVVDAQRRFVTDASHELRTPLARLRADIDLAQRPTRTHEELVEAFKQIDEHAVHLTTLADSLLGLLAPPGLELSPTSTTANELLADVRAHTVSNGEVAFEMSEEVGEAVLLCDAHGVVSSLSNLIQNAIKHGAPPVEVSAHRSDVGFDFVVRDHGLGIPPELRKRVVEPFAQGPNVSGGTGLGLAIVKGFAERQGGSLVIEDADPGCRMILQVPFSPLSSISQSRDPN